MSYDFELYSYIVVVSRKTQLCEWTILRENFSRHLGIFFLQILKSNDPPVSLWLDIRFTPEVYSNAFISFRESSDLHMIR